MDHPSPTAFKNATLSPWVDLATQIPSLLKSSNLRSQIDALPILSPDYLDPESIDEYRLAFVLLTFLSQAYIWGNIDSDTHSSTLPASISVPLTQISRDLEIQPAFCYAAGSIWLYTEDPINKKPYCVCSFTGTADEEHFNITTHNVERTAGKALIQGLTAARCAGMKNKEGTKVHLERVAEILRDCRTALADMRNGCDPDVFYFKLRPYFVGSQVSFPAYMRALNYC
jgi:indoleamine 2,3-dioxygenase